MGAEQRGTVDRRYNELSPQVRALLDAYASGLNAYAANHSGEVRLASLTEKATKPCCEAGDCTPAGAKAAVAVK